jgi:hypothetical protein
VTTDSLNSRKRWCIDITNKRVMRTITTVPTHAAILDQEAAARCPPRDAREETILQAPRLHEMEAVARLLLRARQRPRDAL